MKTTSTGVNTCLPLLQVKDAHDEGAKALQAYLRPCSRAPFRPGRC